MTRLAHRSMFVTLNAVALAALLIYRHKENIGPLLAGTESPIGAKKPDSA